MNCKVLIVDDSPILRMAIKKVVRLAGVDEDLIFQAGNGQEALNLLEDEWIDLILLDLNMPVMNGEEFVAELRKREDIGDIPVVIVSTEANVHRLDRLKQHGVKHTLHKPFEPEDLCELISTILGVTS